MGDASDAKEEEQGKYHSRHRNADEHVVRLLLVLNDPRSENPADEERLFRRGILRRVLLLGIESNADHTRLV